VALGSKAKASGKWKVGDRAGVLLFRHQCHACIGCRTTNDIRFCKNNDKAGLLNDGGMAEYIIGDADNSVLLPDSVPFEQAAPLMCAGVGLELCTPYSKVADAELSGYDMGWAHGG
jgi:D-arabinose 1-dehydrogenase-like Zn-dependent alcohol dehydrogenase